MTIPQIYDRMDELVEMIHNNTEDQDCVFNCEMELDSLEQEREILEESEHNYHYSHPSLIGN